ncbi:MAG: 4Fe-4S dicluster domain-containing protein [Candidatus Geothermincolia bacterium]
MRYATLIPIAFVMGHIVSGEHSPVRMFLMRVFARYVEVPLLHISYVACVGRLKFLSRFFLTRWLILYPIAYPFGHYGDTGRPVPAVELLDLIDGLEGPIAVGPCRCRMGHRACGHPMDTDIVIKTGTDVWLNAFPYAYRTIDKDEAKQIVRDCASRGMFQMVFLHCLLGGAMNEYVICNCCTDGCVPYLLNRTLGQDIYPLVKGEWRAVVDKDSCERCGKCIDVCPFGARVLAADGPSVLECFGCGLCASRCAARATTMRRTAS